MTKVCIVNGHPDPSSERFIGAICDAAEAGALAAGHEVTRIDVGALKFGFLDSADAFAEFPDEPVLSERRKIAEAEHLFLAFPLWLGGMPAKLRAFFEHAARADFFIERSDCDQAWPHKMMTGKSAHVVVTMGMPGLVYRFGLDAGALKALERGMLGLSGFHPIHHTILGGIGSKTDKERARILQDMEALGASAH